MREKRCSYLRVFLLSNIRVKSGCRNWPTQQRISLATIPHNLREISWLKPRKILTTAPQRKTALQPQRLPNLDCVSPSLSHPGHVSTFLGLRQHQEALRQLWEPLRQLRWPLWSSVQHLAAFVWPCVTTCCSCIPLFGCSAAIPTLSLPLCPSVLNAL